MPLTLVAQKRGKKMTEAGGVRIRPLTREDLPTIAEIDTKLLGQQRPGYWEMKLSLMEKHAQNTSLVAELEGKVVGFIIGGVSRWEFGIPENVGWIDTIGVDPDYQRQGIARRLFEHMTQALKDRGVESIYTLVTRRDWRLINFFRHLGFQEGDTITLELDL